MDFVWRAVRRMGVRPADMDDVVQEVFFIVHRRLAEFQGRAQLKTWVSKILVHVVRHYWRAHQRKPGDSAAEDPAEIQTLAADHEDGPAATLERVEALRVLYCLLAELDPGQARGFCSGGNRTDDRGADRGDRRGEREHEPLPRLRAARQEFEKALLRFRAHELRRQP